MTWTWRTAREERERGTRAEAGVLERLHTGGTATMKSEFTSPPPYESCGAIEPRHAAAAGYLRLCACLVHIDVTARPLRGRSVGALDFSREGAAELSCFVRLLRHLGAGAPGLTATANGSSNLHVHVNVRSASAGGDVLTVAELLAVYFAWVKFDLVTARFARPWMWREPSVAPLYATGSEFQWHEKAWEQGHAPGGSASGASYDVPEFLRAVRTLHREEGFAALPDAARLEKLFGRAPSTPASRIGRYCSLNLRKLTTYGTLEFRRFHGHLDPALAVSWAHFCVAFVECFRASRFGAHLLQLPRLEDALAELAASQEAATAAHLMEEMEGFVDPGTAEYFMRESI